MSEDIRKEVRKEYAKVAKNSGSCCGGSTPCGCSKQSESVGKGIGYSDEELSIVPDGANMGLGCGNPTALASLKKGETVLDLGSGGGFDCFLAAKKVGKEGRVIGVDMTPEMVEKARANAKKGSYSNVEFRLGEIENLPVADNSVDVVISNCVINLSPDKERVFGEVFRVLKTKGRILVSDVVLLSDLPQFLKESTRAYAGCVAGAMKKQDYLAAMGSAGLKGIEIAEENAFPLDYIISDPSVGKMIDDLQIKKETLDEVAKSVVSIRVKATK